MYSIFYVQYPSSQLLCTTFLSNHLLRLLRQLRLLALTSRLRRFWSGLSVHHVIPPSEAASIVSDELFVVNIMMLGTSPERKEMVQTPWEIVTAVRIDSLEETAGNPEIHGQDVEVLSAQSPDNRDDDGTGTENHGFDRGRVFGGESEGGRVLVVNLVDVLVEESPVEDSVHPVMPCILQDEEDRDLKSHGLPRRERDASIHATRLGHWVKEPDLREFDGEMTE